MTRRFGSVWLHASASGLALAAACLATAHTAAAQTTSQTAQQQSNKGADVVITAERRSINLQVAPVAAVVATGHQLQQRGVYNVDQLQFISPSLTVTNYGVGENFNIRGVGKGETNVQTPAGVVVYRDGVPTFPGFFTGEQYFDLANIEILRGPQGTFAGANASGGAIFITENDPNFSGDHGNIEAQYGNYNDVRLRGVLNLPVSDTVALRFAVSAEHEDSWYNVHGPFTGDPGRLQQIGARFSLLWQPSSNLRITYKNDYTYIDYGGELGSPIPTPAAPPYPTYANTDGLFNVANNVHNLAIEMWDRNVLNIAYTFNDGIVLKSISGYQYGQSAALYSLDGLATLPASYFSVQAKEQIWSEEVDLISPSKGPLNWVGGVFLQSDTVHIPGTRPGFDISTPPLDILLDYTTPKTTEAVFGQISYDVTEQLQLYAGARYTHSQFTLDDVTSLLIFGLPGALFGDPPEPAHAVQNDDKVTAKIGLNWTLDPHNFFYAFVATGHKPGGINTTPQPFGPGSLPVVPFNPEDETDYEIGWKPTWFDGHLRAQLDGFYTTYEHFQLSYSQPSVAGNASIIQNIPGTTTIYGVEGQAQAVFGPWSFNVSGAYLHTQLGSSAKGLGNPSGIPENISGNTQPLAPEWTFNAGVQYVFHLGDGSTLSPRVDYAYISDQWGSPFQGTDPTVPLATRQLERYEFHLKPINVFNAQLVWDKGPVELTLYGTNIFNEQYFYPSGTPGLRVAAPPAQFGLRATRSF
jgi:iron complex outermembrane recepter protein